MDRKDSLKSGLSGQEKREIEKRSTIRAVVVNEAIRMEGDAELARTSDTASAF